jgi:hypothetical protein
MRTRRAQPALFGLSLAAVLIVAACGSGTSPAPEGSQSAVPSVPPAEATPNAAQTPSTGPEPTPTPEPVWSKPQRVGPAAECSSVTAGIDAAGRSHIVAWCGKGLRYAVTDAKGTWTATVLPVAAKRMEVEPQIGFQGNVVYIAYSLLAMTDGGCGDDGWTDVGVFYRQRTLPNGAWSQPKQIGNKRDYLEAFRVDGATLHAVVAADDGGGDRYYLIIKAGAAHRYQLPKALGPISLRIGNDGRARIAYSLDSSIRIATFTGSGFSTTKVPESVGINPVLVLDGRDRLHVVWTRLDSHIVGGYACGGPDDRPTQVGMYYATNATGVWRTQHVTRKIGGASLQLDEITGQPYLLLAFASSLTYYAITADGAWHHEPLLSKTAATSAVIRRNPATGRLLVVYLRTSGDTSKQGIYALSKP